MTDCSTGANPTAGLATDTLIFKPASYVERLDLSHLFKTRQPIEVELGSGDGSFLAAHAAANPDRNFVAVERLLGRLRKLDRKGLRAGLSNLRLIRLEASYVLEYLLPSASTRVLHVYFPDPWPKRRHWKYRLINERFSNLARQVLEPAGEIYMRTDNSDYFAQMTRVFDANDAFVRIETPESLAAHLTDFEREFHAKGIPTLRAAYRRQTGRG